MQIQDLLDRSGYQYTSTEHKTNGHSPTKTPFEVLLDSFGHDDFSSSKMLVLYTHSDRTGHCINLFHALAWDVKRSTISFMDFQHKTRIAGGGSAALEADLRNAASIVTLLKRDDAFEEEEQDFQREVYLKKLRGLIGSGAVKISQHFNQHLAYGHDYFELEWDDHLSLWKVQKAP